jgi:hypothetical protein
VRTAELPYLGIFAALEHDQAAGQIRAWWSAGATEAQIIAVTGMGAESVRRAIGGIAAKPHS